MVELGESWPRIPVELTQPFKNGHFAVFEQYSNNPY
jgi:hypothetical protein